MATSRLLCWTILCLPSLISAAVFTPPYFNLAQGRNITATATCGYGVPHRELFCRLTGAATSGVAHTREPNTGELIQGQLCDYCDPNNPDKDHRVEYAIDGTERWWQSPPLSRLGPELNMVNVTINLGQEFHVAYVYMRMANSPRPGVWVLERSKDFGKTWQPWQYFADTPSDCVNYFKTPADQKLTQDTQILCTTEFSKVVPLSNGEIVVSLVNGRPNANNFSYADDLQEWTRATDIQLRLLRTKTLLGHLMAVAQKDPTVTRRYYYSIKDISIGGRCVCNGHAESCDVRDPSTNKLLCGCIHNTCGDQCERCCPGYTQKKWRRALVDQPFQCEPCQCFGHSSECIYDENVDRNRDSIDIYGSYEGGGVCQNCRDNTMGINCDKCVPGYYRPYDVPRNALDACQPCKCDLRVSTGECKEGSGRCLCRPEYTGELCDMCSFGYYGYPECIPCDCDINGTENSVCTVSSGSCPCKFNYAGTKCNQCAPGYYNFPECKPCECSDVGSSSTECGVQSGQCQCLNNYAGRDCSECADGYFDFPNCNYCDCERAGTKSEVCTKDKGQCVCNDNYIEERCDRCAPGFFKFPECLGCQCASPGSINKICSETNGQCRCFPNFSGINCNRCAPGYYRYPECIPCQCDRYGSLAQTCDQVSGQCRCKDNFVGVMCEKCGSNLYNYPICEVCNCNPDGAKLIPGYPLGGCGIITSGLLCECKEKVKGRICDTCKPGYWNLHRNHPEGCESCTCNKPGTLAGVNQCDMKTGQCECKPRVAGKDCDRCQDGFYNLQERNPFGCVDCQCDRGGSLRSACNKVTGDCVCKPRIAGQKCDQAITGHYVPTLQQYKYEVEDGKTPEGTRIRYGYDTNDFPNFSWRGYAVLTKVQPEVRLDVDIRLPSLYQMIYRYINLGSSSVKGVVTFSPDSPTETTQTGEVTFIPTREAKFATVTSDNSQSFVLNPGLWTVKTNVPDYILLDYFVLVPNPYYEASQVQKKVTNPCLVSNDTGPCIHFKYPDLEGHPKGLGKSGFVTVSGSTRDNVVLSTDDTLTKLLGSEGLAPINFQQNSFRINLEVPKPDEYLIFINYHNPESTSKELVVEVVLPTGNKKSVVTLASCPFSTLCRQVLSEPEGWEAVYNITTGQTTLLITAKEIEKDTNVFIDSVYAISKSVYHHDLIMPKTICVKVNGVCVPSMYGRPVGAIRIDFEQTPNEDWLSKNPPPDINEPNIGLINLRDTVKLVDHTSCPLFEDDKTDQCQTEKVTAVVPLELYGQITKPGQYVFIIHYYMPTEPGLTLPVSVFADGKESLGVFSPQFCPNTAGCRATIKFDVSGGNTVRLTGMDIKVVFNGTKEGQIWLDYMLIIPVDQFNSDFLDLLPVDKSGEFLTKCIDEGFQLKTDDKFCKDGAFTITTNFNNGALDCNCNSQGSLSFTCDTFGGFCQCKDNIIGRTCSACRPGYYGFPNCKPCNCPYGVCQEETGECICPPLVEGVRCERCKPEAYGYDVNIGCQECKCHPDGVQDGNLSCDQISGQCYCNAHVGGRRCNSCKPGFHSFPYCEDCACDIRGTKADICDQRTSTCFCKELVEGPKCNTCVDGTFSLTIENPKGCTKCFCFGHTTRCESTKLSWYEINTMSDWRLSNDKEVMREVSTVYVRDITDGPIEKSSVYWVAPNAYLKKKINSYGGKLKYTVNIELAEDREVYGIIHPDVIVSGSNMTIIHIHNTQPSPKSNLDVSVQLVEYNFVHDGTNAPVSREQFMMILINIDSLLIRATYYSEVQYSSLQNVRLETATVNGFGEVARTVEECQCPTNYRGASCEDCTPGYFRARHTPYLGICLKCNCNGHSDSCDVVTGECFNCQDNTTGPHCEQCLAGYYGDPENGPCRICSCPLPILSNNFATTCNANEDQGTLQCSCFPGYAGVKCQSCDSGYYGNPLIEGSYCQPCSCSGNIDINNPRSCDRFTGDCLICERHTAGSHCEYCKDWFWGDAITLKNCQECSCDRCGSETCYKENGFCQCKPNVVGLNCDMCADNTWGFDFCKGCQECHCGTGAATQQCNQLTGICTCQPGVEGDKCDRCKPGHWKLGAAGCEVCSCDFGGAVGCDPETGRCQCLPGVTGEKCDRCLPRWVLVANKGCQECDYCVHLLMDDLDALSQDVSVVNRQLQEVSVGAAAFNRLSLYKDTVTSLRPFVDKLNTIEADDFKERLVPLSTLLENHSLEIKALNERSEAIFLDGSNLPQEITELLKQAYEALNSSKELILLGEETIRHIGAIDQKLMESSNRNIETTFKDGQQILVNIEAVEFTSQSQTSSAEKDNSHTVLDRASRLKETAIVNWSYALQLDKEMEAAESRLMDLQKNSRYSMSQIEGALGIIRRLRAVQLENLKMSHQTIDNVSKERDDLIDASKRISAEAGVRKNKTLSDIQSVEVESSKLDSAIPRLREKVNEIGSKMEELSILKNLTNVKADSLQKMSLDVNSVYDNTRNSSENAVVAGQSYKVIISSIFLADISVEEALTGSRNSRDELTEIEANATNIRNSTDVLELQAKKAEKDAKEKNDKELSKFETLLNNADDDLNKLSKTLQTVQSNIERLSGSDVSQTVNKVMREVGTARHAIDEALSKTIRARNEYSNNSAMIDFIKNISKSGENARDITDEVKSAESDLATIGTELANVSSRVSGLLPKAEALALSVAYLKEQIARARDEANRIKVGLNFLGNTSVTLRNPAKLEDTGSFTKLSVYFKTTRPDALLIYVGENLITDLDGNREKRSSSDEEQKDYLALEIREGKAVFTFNLGSGPGKITSNIDVNDEKWHQAIAERIGKSGKLTIQSMGSDTDDVVEGSSQKTFTVLELSVIKSIFLVGGVSESVEIPQELTREPFVGGMEDLRFDGEPIGLWNYIDGVNNNVGYLQRDFMQEIFTEGVYFNGQGYAALAREPFQLRGERTRVSFQFKTYVMDGLLFYMGNKDYFSVELNGGHIVFRFDLGSGPAVARSNDVYNNGSWTSVSIDRDSKIGLLIINNKVEDIHVESRGTLKTLEIGPDIYVGGIDSAIVLSRDITTTSFEGCIKDFSIGTLSVNPLDNKRSKGLIKGCPEKVAHIVTFPASKSGYIGLKAGDIGAMFDVTFKIKTKELNGLLLFASNFAKSNVFAVVMSDGQIKIVEEANQVVSQLASLQLTYNDGRWHYISIMKMGKQLTMSIDDINVVTYNEGPEEINIDTPFYFGGLPSSFNVSSDIIMVPGLSGCIGDITINKKFQNLANIQESKSISLAECAVMKHETSSIQNCALPSVASDIKTSPDISGTRYGLTVSSRTEYVKLPNLLKGPTTISATFKTASPNGVIFYTSDRSHTDHLSIFMLNGKVHLSFNFGTGTATAISTEKYDDNTWHTVKIVRVNKEGTLYIDENLVAKGTSPKIAVTLNVVEPHYIGGLPDEDIRKAMKNLKNLPYTGFTGCIKDLTLDNKNFPAPVRSVNTSTCSSSDESGAFFGQNGGYLKLAEKFKVHIEMDIRLEIRPRSQEGILLAVHNKSDFAVLQLTEGDVVFTVDNGAGPITARYKASSKFSLCNGNWHTIHALKNGSVLTLNVDGTKVVQQGGKTSASAADTNDPLYIGGLEDLSSKGVTATGSYVGCIRNVYINNKFNSLYLSPNGDVRIDACPAE